jgi:hypothetical protein
VAIQKLPDPQQFVRTVPLHAAFGWSIDALRLWRQAPFMLFLLTLAWVIVEGLVQLIPVAGVALSKMIMPILDVGILIGLDQLARGDGLRFSTLVQGFRRDRLPMLPMIVACGLVVFLTQLIPASLIFGPDAADMILFNHMHPKLLNSTFVLTLILPGMVPVILLGLVAPLMVFHGVPPLLALKLGVSRVLSAWPACLLFMVITTLAFAIALASPWLNLLLLAVLPWSMASIYVFYRDVITGELVPPRASSASLPIPPGF